MADFPQRMNLPQDLDVKHVGKLESLDFANGFTVKASAAAQTVTPPGVGNQRIVFATGDSFNGLLYVNMTSGAKTISFTLSVAAKRLTDQATQRNGIEVLSMSNSDLVGSNILTFELYQNNTDQRVAVVANFAFTTVSAWTVDVAASGKNVSFPVGPLTSSEFPTKQTAVSISDVRDVMVAKPIRNTTAPVNLDGQVDSGTVVCQAPYPALSGTYPSESVNTGSLLVLSSADSLVVTQMWFPEDSMSPWIRYSSNRGASWTPWVMVFTRTNIQEVLDTASATALVWAIVMG